MKKIVLAILLAILSQISFGQEAPAINPRVIELEDKLTEEASLYFSRRYPGEPFFVKAEVVPLRRNISVSQRAESLPYYDQDAEELVDEWDDPATPLSVLRSRVIRVNLEVSIPLNFDEQKVTEIKQELPVFLKLLPYRDVIKVERKFKGIEKETPTFVYYLFGGLVLASIIIGFMMRWSISKIKPREAQTNAQAPTAHHNVAPPQSFAQKNPTGKSSTAVSGDVTFHDPIKMLDIAHIKLKQIENSHTFPTLKDVMLLSELAERHPEKLGAIVCELPLEWQKDLYKMGKNKAWLDAYSHPGHIDPECLGLLDKISRHRHFIAGDRHWEDLLIQMWRLGDKAMSFFKKIDQEHAFIILHLLPKSLSLEIAKKAFPGGWGKLLEKKSSDITISTKQLAEYLNYSLELVPWYEWKLLEDYKKDSEILSYLNKVSIDDEKDLYETLTPDSFIFQVRPPFYKIFNLDEEKFKKLVSQYPLEKWALVVMNSSRSYVRHVSDHLDEKKRIVFSSHLRHLDQRADLNEEQGIWRQQIAKSAYEIFPDHFTEQPVLKETSYDEKTP